jgi:hypothetical protein
MRNSTPKRVVFMCGPGGSGKGTVLKELKSELGDRVMLFPSTNRAAADKAGFSNEKEMLSLTPKDHTKVQIFIYKFYREALTKALTEFRKSDAEILLTERSPIDYLAYIDMIRDPGSLTTNELTSHGVKNYKEVHDRNFDTFTVMLPWPVPWYGNGGTEDGFRHVDSSKESTLHLSGLNFASVLSRTPHWIHFGYMDAETLSVDARISWLCKSLGIALPEKPEL